MSVKKLVHVGGLTRVIIKKLNINVFHEDMQFSNKIPWIKEQELIVQPEQSSAIMLQLVEYQFALNSLHCKHL